MQFHNPLSEIYVPDEAPVEEALSRSTHLGIGTHQDDIEIMAYHGILECFGKASRHFTGVTVTNGAGSPRDDLYKDYTDEGMQNVRRWEQKKAAFVGEYAAHIFLDYTSAEAKDKEARHVIEDLKQLITSTRPEVIYTHNLADKHDTHVATALRVIEALRNLPPEAKPRRFYGCEVWRALDWLQDDDKVVFNVEGHENLAMSLVGVFDSQINGGKRYDLATMGRRRANATYFASHGVDASSSVIYGIDLTPLINDEKLDIAKYVHGFIERFDRDVAARTWRGGLATPKIGQTPFQDTHFLLLVSSIFVQAICSQVCPKILRHQLPYL
jgi:LmbE family N-acetylglucosaminyl deacetylase